MYYQIGDGDLYRVTRPDTVWPEPVQGRGAFYSPKDGSRYNRPHQRTVSCSEDPLAAMTEAAFYQALQWREAIASSLAHPVAYPFRSEHLFWAFRIDPPPPVIDLEHAGAIVAFGYSPHVVTNPSQDYRATQEIADMVRSHTPPLGSPDPPPEGVRAPAVRAPKVGDYQPKQLALFVMDKDPIVPDEHRSILSARMRLELEFSAALPTKGAVNYHSAAINWTKPKFKLSVIAGRHGSRPFLRLREGQWQRRFG